MRLIILCLLLGFLDSGNDCKSSNVDLIVRLADSLCAQKQFENALLEYQRAYFFSDGEVKSKMGARIGDCYLMVNDLGRARNYYDSAVIHTKIKSSLTNLQFSKVLCLILEENFGYALIEANKIEVDSNSYQQKRKYLYQGICHFGTRQYDESFDCLRNSLPANDTVKLINLERTFENHRILFRPDKTLATILSIVLPGTGQIYSGDFKSGMNSILLLGGLYFIGSTLSVTGFIIIIPFLYRYYVGGILNARQAAEAKQKEKQHIFYLKMMEVILE